MRTRTRSVGPSVLKTSDFVYGGTTANYDYSVVPRTETITDVVTPNYKELIERGAIINNPCTYSMVGLESSPGSSLRQVRVATFPGGQLVWDWQTYSDLEGHVAYAIHKYAASPPFVAPLRQAQASPAVAKSKALAAIDSTPYGFLEDAFEIKETLRFLRNPAQTLTNLVKDADRRSRRLRRRKRFSAEEADALGLPNGASIEAFIAKATADIWLACRFAIAPLARSLQDGGDAIYQTIRHAKREKRRTARGFDKVTYETKVGPWEQTFHYQRLVRERFFTSEQNIHAGILYEVDNPVVDYPFFLGMRAKDVPEALWAVAPWSFIIDRVFNISDAIRGLTNMSDPSVTIQAAWTTTKTLTRDGGRVIGQANETSSSYRYVSFAKSEWAQKNFLYDRQPWNPSFIDAIPPLQLKGLVDDATKVADILALAVQILSKQPFARGK